MSIWLAPVDDCAECDDLEDDETCERHGLPEEVYDWLHDVNEANAGRLDGEEFVQAAAWGAGWAFAIVGMAQAIRDTAEARAYYDVRCNGCGADVGHQCTSTCPFWGDSSARR